MSKYFFLLSGIEPAYFFVPFEPCHLFTGVDAGVLLNLLNGERQCPFAVKVIEYFLITHCIQGVERPIRIDAAYFFHKSVGYHLFHASVYAVVQLLTVTCETYFYDTKRAFLFLLRAERPTPLSAHSKRKNAPSASSK